MSTDWIKMRVDLRTHPKVVRMATALKADKLRVVGGLFAVWAIFDAHSSDGFLDGYTFRAIDDELNWKGFAKAMAGIDWLVEQGDEGLTAPRFDEHNGTSAKRRAMETERKRLEREAEKNATKTGQLSASDADKSVTREEKRREEEKQGSEQAEIAARAAEESAKEAGFTPSPGAIVTLALKRCGIFGNPGDPRLAALLDAGATVEEFVSAAPQAIGKGNPWTYLLGTVEGQRNDAARISNTVHRGAMPQQETPGQRAARERVASAVPGIAAKSQTVNAEVIDVTARRLG